MLLELKFVIYAVLLILMTAGFSLFILWLFRRLKAPRKYRWIALFPLLFLVYGLYQGLTSPYSLYEGHFEEITGLELPVTTEFIDYTDWGYGTYPAQNSSLFHVKVETEFYVKLKAQLNPSDEPLTGLKQEVKYRLESMIGENFIDRIDYQYSKYDSQGGLLYAIVFFEEDHSLLVHAWKD